MQCRSLASRGRCLLAVFCFSALSLHALPSLKDVVEGFDTAQAKAKTFQARFNLTLHRAMLKTPTLTKGTLYIQDSDYLHFAFEPPEDLILRISPKELISYSPATKEGEQLKIGFIRNANRRFLGLGHRLSAMSDYFKMAISEGPVPGAYGISLSPRSLDMRKRFQSIQIWIDKSTYLPRQIKWIERSGDTWDLELNEPRVNESLPKSVQDFKVPAQAKLRKGFSFFGSRKSK